MCGEEEDLSAGQAVLHQVPQQPDHLLSSVLLLFARKTADGIQRHARPGFPGFELSQDLRFGLDVDLSFQQGGTAGTGPTLCGYKTYATELIFDCSIFSNPLTARVTSAR